MMQKPTLIPGAKRVARKAWSVRLAVLSAMLTAADVALPYMAPEHPSKAFAVAAGLVALGAALARLVAQPKLWGDRNG